MEKLSLFIMDIGFAKGLLEKLIMFYEIDLYFYLSLRSLTLIYY